LQGKQGEECKRCNDRVVIEASEAEDKSSLVITFVARQQGTRGYGEGKIETELI
jgi:hypothetical protein